MVGAQQHSHRSSLIKILETWECSGRIWVFVVIKESPDGHRIVSGQRSCGMDELSDTRVAIKSSKLLNRPRVGSEPYHLEDPSVLVATNLTSKRLRFQSASRLV